MASTTVSFPGKLSESGTESAKNGISMAEMLAQLVESQRVMAAQLASVQVGNVGKAQNGKGKGVKPVASGPVKTAKNVTRTAKPVTEAKEAFDARVWFSLGPAIAATEDGLAYVAESMDEGRQDHPIVFVGVQRKAICLNVDKARILYGLLEGYFTAPDAK